MKNLGSRWTVPDIARTAAARSSFLVAISSERDSGSSSSSSSSNSIIINDSSSSSSIRSRSISVKVKRSNVRSSGSGINRESIKGRGRVTAIEKYKRGTRGNGRSAVDVLHESNLSVRSYVTASSNRFDGTTRPESTTTTRYRPLAGKSRGSQHRSRPRQPQPQPPQQPLYYPPASWDTRTLHFRNC